MKSANQKENWKHGCFFFSYSTQFWRLDTSDRQQSLVQGDAPLGAIISWGGSDSIAQFKDLYFHRVFHRGDIASTEQLEPSTTRFLSRSMDLHPKINFSEIESYVLFFSSRSCLQRWKIFLLKALQWELKTFQRGWGLLMHSWYTRQYWREQYLLKGITNISHIHMQTAAQESKQCGQSSTARFFLPCTCWCAVAGYLHYVPGIQSCKNVFAVPTCCSCQWHNFHYKYGVHCRKTPHKSLLIIRWANAETVGVHKDCCSLLRLNSPGSSSQLIKKDWPSHGKSKELN